jgi:hypothetical protein
MSLSLPLESESSSAPSPMWRKLGELLLSIGEGEGVVTESRRKDVIPRGRLARYAALEGCRGKSDGGWVEVVDGVLSTDWGLVVTCVALETRWGDGECDGDADVTGCGQSPEVGYGEWDVDMGPEDKPPGESGDGMEALEDRTLAEVGIAEGAEWEWGRMWEDSGKGDSGSVGGRDVSGEAKAGVKRDRSRYHIWNTWWWSTCRATCGIDLAYSDFVGSIKYISLCENGKPIRVLVGRIEYVCSYTLHDWLVRLVS